MKRVLRAQAWLYINIEVEQIGVCATFIQELRESCEIDWYLQAEVAYNKQHKKNKLRKFVFYNTQVIPVIKIFGIKLKP
ncbi:hypothetical protein [Colwellia sp. 12G3]|uniref:hypothetical protein n=1 Tax=Colwellia sp. 12G3 TaxID=2058299 RepID=UPI000C34A5BF|nr:hypothetical protein [Colwellia sp. 12G3]PKI14148.1 hypothetical protein CXF71_16365 [Colwellia sp. 12G3]